MDEQHFYSQLKQVPYVGNQLILSSMDRGWRGFAALFVRTCPTDDFAPEPADLTQMDRLTLHFSGTGQVEHRFNEGQQQGKSFPGSFCLTPKGCPSAWRWNHPATILNIYFFSSWLTQIASETDQPASHCLGLRYLFNEQDPLIQQIGRSLHTELQARIPAGEFLGQRYAESLVHTLAIHLLRNYSTFPLLPPTRFPPPCGLPPRQLRHVKKHIQEHLGADHSLIELAATIGLSPSYFSRQFKQSTSLSPHQYLIQCRVERAKSLLIEGSMLIADIAHQVGFADQSHLTRHFHRAFGVSPGMVGQNGKNGQKESRIIQDNDG
jgi:AraC family transcriptional regulator